MSEQHTPTPWRVGKNGCVVCDTPVPEMSGSEAVEYYEGHLIAESVLGRNARRIVACVNACEEFTNEQLESAHLELADVAEVAKLVKQRDELLAAAKAAYDLLKVIHDETGKVGSQLRAAIAKAEQGKP